MAKLNQFGKILKSWADFEGLLSLCQNCELILAKNYAFGPIFIIVNVQLLKKLSTHLVTRYDYLLNSLSLSHTFTLVYNNVLPHKDCSGNTERAWSSARSYLHALP